MTVATSLETWEKRPPMFGSFKRIARAGNSSPVVGLLRGLLKGVK